MTTVPPEFVDMTLPQMLRHRATVSPGAIAFRKKDRGVWKATTWKEYFDTARLVAIGLWAAGFRPGDRLAIAGDNNPEWILTDLATQMVGGACLGIYPTNPWPEMQYILRHSKAKVVLCGDQEQIDKVLEARARDGGLPDLLLTVCVDMKGLRHYDPASHVSFAHLLDLGRQNEARYGPEVDKAIGLGDADDVAVIVYTSGTTGMPKGAMLSHRNLTSTASEVAKVLGLSDTTYSILCYLPLCHVAERSYSMVMQLLVGSVVNFAESVDTVVLNLREIAPQGFLGVPRIWEKMQQSIVNRVKDTTPLQRWVFNVCMARGKEIAMRRFENGGAFVSVRDRLAYAVLWLACFRGLLRFLGLDRVRNSWCGGASVSPEVMLFFRTLGVPVYQIYGMTECGGVSHTQRPGYTSSGCAGITIDGVEQMIAEDGEILLKGPGIFRGYLFDEKATASAMEGGWLHTGDIVSLAPNGEISVVDRKKDILITSGGKNITPSLIENALKDSPYIQEAIIVGDGRHFLSALIQISFESVGKWAQEQKIPYTTYRTLAENPRVNAFIAEAVAEVNARFARVENIRKFVILKKELDHDDGELTATMKIRRNIIEKKFSDEIKEIYGEAA